MSPSSLHEERKGVTHDERPCAFGAFTSAVASRLRAGERDHENRSFARPPGELVGEIEELFDVCAWSFILWCRIHSLRKVMEGPSLSSPGCAIASPKESR
jgi:hypothetical protein